MPAPGFKEKMPGAQDWQEQTATLLIAIREAAGPVVLVGNEIGLGVIPLGREVRAFVDALGGLNQRVAAACERVTLVAAGLPWTLKTRKDSE
jgi:adenosylcobinamide kinase/adenosylcobinamide-phosphate guanylyltransferase